MHIAILMANTDESDFSDQHPKDGEKWPALLSPFCPDCKFSVYSVKDNEFPDRPLSDYDGFIITGSPASILHKTEWQARLAETIRAANAEKIPMFGACFGHQAIALALGGTVAANPEGWVLGVTDSNIHTPAPWMNGDTGPLLQNAAHEEQVTKAPQDAQILMSNKSCPIGAFTIGTHVFTTQYHPEITPHFMDALITELQDVKPADVIAEARQSMTQSPENARFARWIMDFFKYAQ